MVTKNTFQRNLILNILKEKATHLTADKIYEAARKQLPSISLGTIYRNLKILTDQNKLSETKLLNYSVYEHNLKPHSHLICRRCGEIKDIQLNIKQPKVDKEFLIEQTKLTITGLCRFCKQF